ncbi:MAG: alanine dehydrogenase, partial [Anaerotignaceae bacterium]
MPGAVPRTSTLGLTNTTLKYGLEIASKGLERACLESEPLKKGLNVYKGNCTYKAVADTFGIEYVPAEKVLQP